MLKAEMMYPRDDVALGRRQFASKRSISQCVKPPPQREINATSPTSEATAEPRIIYLRKADHYAYWKRPGSILVVRLVRMELPNIDGRLSISIVSNTRASSL